MSALKYPLTVYQAWRSSNGLSMSTHDIHATNMKAEFEINSRST